MLLLHGLCGVADEWTETASWLRSSLRVVAFDQRGHGRSTQHPLDVRQSAFVSDVVAVIESTELRDVALVG